MNTSFQSYTLTPEQIGHRILDIFSTQPDETPIPLMTKQLVGFIDLTTLEGTDTRQRIVQLCEKALRIRDKDPDRQTVAAVCVYSPFVALAKSMLSNSGVKVACAAGGFPSGQLPLSLKCAEIRYALDQGADEIDTVINRGKLLESNENEVLDEIAAVRGICQDRMLKVILETGELDSVQRIRRASELAILAGADFIKTSTGKIQPAATEPAVLIMLDTIKEYAAATGKRIGIKPAGGIQQPEQALRYYRLVHQILGQEWLSPGLF
ncbi:MAG TPA: deoxyribose-phosphate aldolase, partial [Bacteroidales bacterium]|nr:deoxyribose-phosphate aldolase [Bacteroidales bacterium]